MGAIFLESSSEDNSGFNNSGMINNKLITFEILSVILQLLSIVFNGAIICTLTRRSLLRYPSNRFVFSLCISHLTVSFFSVLISLVTTFIPLSPSSVLLSSLKISNHHHVFDESKRFTQPTTGSALVPAMCSAAGVDLAHLIMMHLNFGVAVCTSITVALISVERYITIARPMRYKSIVTARRSLYAIICCWLLTALITMMPLLLFENRDPVCGTFSVPMESLATYFGIVFAVVTVFALAVMIVCYTHIFRIAKAKCQKVQIGHFTASTVSSISSDWPSSVYSSPQGQHRFLHAGSRIESSNSLLHWVLMSNLGRHVQPLSRVPHALRGGVPRTPPATPVLPPKTAFYSESALNSRRESDETTTTGVSSSRNGSTSSSNSGAGGNTNVPTSSYYVDPSPLFQYHHFTPPRKLRNRWKAYFQPNYNSPRKTIFTIVLLIGSVLFTQLPLSFVLFTSTLETTQRWFQFCTTVLFSTSSVANPVLYGFLNRSIRDQLWRILKRKSRHGGEHGPSASSIRKRKRGQQQQLDEIAQNSKGFLSPASQRHLQSLCRNGNIGAMRDIPAIKISRKESISSDDNSSVHSVTSTNSINTIGTSAKAKINQVQKRTAIASSPYYRSVLLKKASNDLSKSNSLLPHLVLPDINIRRNSSDSIISIRNGVMSKMMKEKVKEVKEERSSMMEEDDTNGRRTSGEDRVIEVEMQTFRNYSTPELSLSQASSSKTLVPNDESSSKSLENNENGSEAKDILIDTFSNNKSDEGQVQTDDVTEPKLCHNGDHSYQESIACDEERSESVASTERTMASADTNTTNDQPGPSRSNSVDVNSIEHPVANESSNGNLEACLSVESLMGILIDEELLPENFPRKPSQDSGADMSFSDEEDEMPVIPAGNILHHASSTPVLLSAASLSSLPSGTVAMLLRTGSKVTGNNSVNEHHHRSSPSLIGPLVLVGHTSDTGNSQASTDVLLLPCSCSKTEDSQSIHSTDEDDDEEPQKTGHTGVTVTITDSNSDTQLYNPGLFSHHNTVNNTMAYQQQHTLLHRHHQPHCLLGRAMGHHKSKSESDICMTNKILHGQNADADLRVRSNNHIAINSSNNCSLSSDDNNHLNINNDTFTLICCDCNKPKADDMNSRNEVNRKVNASSGCSVWVMSGSTDNFLSNGQLPMLTSLSKGGSLNILKTSGSNLNLTGLAYQSPQWLSVTSVHSSCSSLSSTCPLRILDGHNKSDASDYDDFEDHIEI